MIGLTPEYLEERFKMIVDLEKVAQRGPKSAAAINAEMKQLRAQMEEVKANVSTEPEDKDA